MHIHGVSTFLIVAGGHDGASKLASTEVPKFLIAKIFPWIYGIEDDPGDGWF